MNQAEIAKTRVGKDRPAARWFCGWRALSVVACAGLALPLPAFALDPDKRLHEFAIRSWGTAQGLPQMSVEALAEGHDGYLWVGTQEGLARFNGFSFQLFDKTVSSGAPYHITTLLERRNGLLTVGSFGGAAVWRKGAFEAVEGLEPFAAHKVLSFAEGKSGTLWVGTSAGAACVTSGRLTRYGPAEGLPSSMVRAVALDASGHVWIGTDGGLAKVVDGRVEAVDQFPQVQVLALAPEREGGLWIGTTQGLAHWTGRSFDWQTVREGLPHAVVGSLLLDSHGALWAGTARGLGRFWKGRWSTLAPSEVLSRIEVAALYEDHEGSLWVGTVSGGLSLIMEGQVQVLGTIDGLSNEVVYTLSGDGEGSVFVGAETGAVDRIAPGLSHATNLVSPAETEQSRIRALVRDSSGDLWIGAESGLFHRTFGRTQKVHLPGLPRDAFRTGTATRSGELWFGTERSGAVRLVNGKVQLLDTSSGLPSNEVRAVLEDAAGNVWIGTHGGLVRWRGGIQEVLTRASGLAHDFVRCLYQDGEGALWVGSYGGGVSRLVGGRIQSLGTAHGLVSDAVFAILEDGERNLWMSSNRGVFRVSRSEIEEIAEGRRSRLQVLRLDQEDGMASAECNGGSPGAWRVPDGRLLFPTLRGVVVVDPARLRRQTESPPAVIEAVSADGQSLDPDVAAVLPPGTERVEVRFSAISLRTSRRIRFWHRLEGFDREWVESGGDRAVQYTRLRPGRYVFHLAACGGEGRCSDGASSYAFEVQPRLHQRWWFIPLAVVSAVVLLALLWLWRMRLAAARERDLQKRIHEALAQIKVLSGLIPICAGCKKIREDTGYWTLVEDYLRRYSDVKFSHGLCPDCLRSLYPEYADSVLGSSANSCGHSSTVREASSTEVKCDGEGGKDDS